MHLLLLLLALFIEIRKLRKNVQKQVFIKENERRGCLLVGA